MSIKHLLASIISNYNVIIMKTLETGRDFKLTREIPPGKCGRKVKLNGIEETYTRGGACCLIRQTRIILPMVVSSILNFAVFSL